MCLNEVSPFRKGFEGLSLILPPLPSMEDPQQAAMLGGRVYLIPADRACLVVLPWEKYYPLRSDA
jgi:hypothetical protein